MLNCLAYYILVIKLSAAYAIMHKRMIMEKEDIPTVSYISVIDLVKCHVIAM